MANMTTALLLSGGMDSIAIAWWRRPELVVTIDYGQRPAKAEIRAASAAAAAIGLEHRVLTIDLGPYGSGDLAGRAAASIAPVREWWPYRNQMLVTLAAMATVTEGIDRILIGCLATDNVHADGGRIFVAAMDALLSGQEGAMRLEAPAINLTAAQLIRVSKVPMEILAWAHSCHVANEACGECRGCRKHYETLSELGWEPY